METIKGIGVVVQHGVGPHTDYFSNWRPEEEEDIEFFRKNESCCYTRVIISFAESLSV